MNYSELSLAMHKKNKGKIEVISKVKVTNREELSTAYTPEVGDTAIRTGVIRKK